MEAKGVLWDAVVDIGGEKTKVVFYDPTRLAQDIAEDIAFHGSFAAKRLLVVPRLTVDSMTAAVEAAPSTFFA